MAETHNATSDCGIDCFLRSVMAMPREEVIAPFSAAFADAAQGGCPTVG